MIDDPRSKHVIISLLEQLKFPLLARAAKNCSSLETLNGYASVILHEASRRNDTHILAAHEHFLGGAHALLA
jgi:hypothetical protein